MTLPQTPADSGWEPLKRLIEDRTTCRQFLPQQVPQEAIEQALLLAQRTPSWCNTQPWQLHVTLGRATAELGAALTALAREKDPPQPDFAFPDYTGESAQRRRECGAQLYRSLGIARSEHERAREQGLRNFTFFGAPHVAIVTTDASLGTYGALDCGLYVGSLLLALQSLGLAAAPQGALAAYSPFLRAYFDIPDDRKVVLGISFGYPDRQHPVNSFRTSRAALADVVSWHRGLEGTT